MSQWQRWRGCLPAGRQHALTVMLSLYQVVDTLGAGDAYNAGFITAAVEGLSLAEANRQGECRRRLEDYACRSQEFPQSRRNGPIYSGTSRRQMNKKIPTPKSRDFCSISR